MTWNGNSLSDTGWISIVTFSTGWGVGGATPQVRVVRGIVYQRGQLARSTGTGTNMATLPSVAFPDATRFGYVRTSTASLPYGISNTGVISISAGYVTGDNVTLDDITPYPIG